MRGDNKTKRNKKKRNKGEKENKIECTYYLVTREKVAGVKT